MLRLFACLLCLLAELHWGSEYEIYQIKHLCFKFVYSVSNALLVLIGSLLAASDQDLENI
jgi:hypothetical protein